MKNTNLKWVVFSIYKVEIQIMAKWLVNNQIGNLILSH
jgi:hypothetical protein